MKSFLNTFFSLFFKFKLTPFHVTILHCVALYSFITAAGYDDDKVWIQVSFGCVYLWLGWISAAILNRKEKDSEDEE